MAKEVVTVRIEPVILESARQLAAERGWTLSHFIAQATGRVVRGELTKRGTRDDGTIPS